MRLIALWMLRPKISVIKPNHKFILYNGLTFPSDWIQSQTGRPGLLCVFIAGVSGHWIQLFVGFSPANWNHCERRLWKLTPGGIAHAHSYSPQSAPLSRRLSANTRSVPWWGSEEHNVRSSHMESSEQRVNKTLVIVDKISPCGYFSNEDMSAINLRVVMFPCNPFYGLTKYRPIHITTYLDR